ncbi:type II secretion system protein [Bacillus sp. Marseille-P3661]|uniref:type II secretion system protein n=1 Tax=Bacillus sp. Marseille-P3661 TaxID=1936234 RepID=UPI002155DAAD|nr:prepilin-type N-terminal cleavage/methylation domain-containing protein [Bacillus sp. Marseille-P3661]
MIKKMKQLLKNNKGFTLVELLAVIVILGIIAAIAVPSIGNIIDNSKKDAHVANARQLIEAARLKVASEGINITTTATELQMTDLVSQGYLESAPKDPTGTGSYTAGEVYVQKNATGIIEYSVWLDGANHDIGSDGTGVKAADLDRTDVTG